MQRNRMITASIGALAAATVFAGLSDAATAQGGPTQSRETGPQSARERSPRIPLPRGRARSEQQLPTPDQPTPTTEVGSTATPPAPNVDRDERAPDRDVAQRNRNLAPHPLLSTPVTNLIPGGGKPESSVAHPTLDDDAAKRGMRYFSSFNCVGCHAPNGGGGMGPSLSNAAFLYGGEPANIYLSIYQGRPKGMPAWGGMLPDEVIWDLVAYVRSISKTPDKPWGTTVSVTTMEKEQVPAEYMQTWNPWRYTQSFSFGLKPTLVK